MKISDILGEAHPLDATAPLELRGVVASYPNTYMKVIRQFWGMDSARQLRYQGLPFFGEDGRTAYDAIEAAVDRDLAGRGVDVDVEMDLSPMDMDRTHDYTYQAEISDKQEVYVGYDAGTDTLYVGFDVWTSEESFNESWDKQFLSATRQEFDNDDSAHNDVFEPVWKQIRDNMFYGMLFSFDGESANEVQSAPGGFYKGIYRTAMFKSLNLVNLRLD
jgi:hypothetical protein